MLKRTASLILTFITLLSLLSIAITPVSATEEIPNTTHENVDDSNGTLDTWFPEYYDSETKEPITSPVLPQQVSEAPITTQPIVTIPPTIVIIKPTSPITSPVIIYPTGVPIVSINTTSVITQPIISTEPSNNTVVIATDPTEEINPPLFTEPAEKLSSTINVSKSSEGKYKVSANATGGSGYYEYQFLVNNTLYQDFSDKNQCTFMLTTNGNYNFKVIVKDSTGNTISTDTTIVVTIDSENTTEHTNSTYPSIPIIEPTETKTTIPVLDFSSDPTTTTKAEATTTSVDKGLLGDVTTDGKVNIRDATAIQKHLAKIKLLSDDALLLADFDQNEKLNIKDATTIQKFIAGLIDNGTHTHKYNKTVIPPTCTEKGYTKHTCVCGDHYLDNWTESQHSFSKSYCIHCNLSSFDYLISWIKANGTLNSTDEYYNYKFSTLNAPADISKYNFSLAYYYTLDEISFYLHDPKTMTGTLISIFRDTIENNLVQCICGSQTFDFSSTTAFMANAHVMNNPIFVDKYESDTLSLPEIIDISKIYAHYTVAVSDYYLKTTNVGITMLDFGFTKEYSNIEGEMPFETGHYHAYQKTDDSHTATESGIATYTCSCGSEFWTSSSHTFESYQCTECGITPYEYYAEWIKENGIINGNRYEYTFTSIYDVDNMEDLFVDVYYYPVLGSESNIVLHLYDSYSNETTMIFLEEDDAFAYCGSGSTNNDYTIYTEIDITKYTDNTPIQPDSDSRYNSRSEIEYARQNINLALSAHRYSMLCEVDGLSLYDLGFYSY